MSLFSWIKLDQLIHLSKVKRSEYVVCEDISNGRERHCLPALSYCRNDQAPKDYHYVSEYVQLDPIQCPYVVLSDLQCCTCIDDCSTSNCSCALIGSSMQRVYNSKKHLSSSYNINAPEVIRECNIGCKCKVDQCNNLIIQNGCQARLALFRTKSRGWGVRTLEDLKRGTFIGVYSGELITAESSHHRSDDTYLFNLTHTHIYPKPNDDSKDREAQEPDVKEDIYHVVDKSETCELSVSYSDATLDSGMSLNECDTSRFSEENDNKQDHATDQPNQEHQLDQFVCDAKYYGNFTRFINHSCEPNVIGIRSFTKHQDARFPYIAFFTNKDIRAQTELTLNYGDNYWLVKCQRDKVFCLCKRSRCRFSKKSFPKTLQQHTSQTNNQQQQV